MADEKLMDLVTNVSLMGILCFSLVSFIGFIVASNNPYALGADVSAILNSSGNEISQNLDTYNGTFDNMVSDTQEGLSKETDGVGSYIGSISTVNAGYTSAKTSTKSLYTTFKLVLYVFNSPTGYTLIGTVVGMFILSMIILVYKFIKQGQ